MRRAQPPANTLSFLYDDKFFFSKHKISKMDSTTSTTTNTTHSAAIVARILPLLLDTDTTRELKTEIAIQSTTNFIHIVKKILAA
jgi:hypothetical protein